MLETVWLSMLSAGIVLFIVSLFLMLYWRVFGLIDELSGRKAKRHIKKLREISNSSVDMSAISTGELGLAVSNGDSLLSETVVKVPSGEKSLKDMIDDPYGSVGKGAKVKKDSYVCDFPSCSDSRYVLDESVTGLFSDVEQEVMSKKSIIIIEEQTSLSKEDML